MESLLFFWVTAVAATIGGGTDGMTYSGTPSYVPVRRAHPVFMS